LLGDPTQRFERGSIDLDSFVEKGKSSPLVGHITFRKSVRSPIAKWAVDNL
jgi:predicted ribonuclease YlaK